MIVVNAREDFPSSIKASIFLAGPSPRNQGISWRPQALAILEAFGFEGVVFSPEALTPYEGDSFPFEEQMEWEKEALEMSDVILFWVPRDLETMPGFTTNIEWGSWFKSGKVVLGYPQNAPKMRVLEKQAKDNKVPIKHSLEETLKRSLTCLCVPATRSGGERYIPLQIWNRQEFQQWYLSQTQAGNVLEKASVKWFFHVGPSILFCWSIWVKIFVTSEGRYKENEVFITRPDIAALIAYYKPEDTYSILDTKIVLVKEFRSSAVTSDGFIHEVPQGSNSLGYLCDDFKKVAENEFSEETGLRISGERVNTHSFRQSSGTLSTHGVHVFSVSLTYEELDILYKSKKAHGSEETEQCFVEIKTLRDILKEQDVDWTNIGIIFEALQGHL